MKDNKEYRNNIIRQGNLVKIINPIFVTRIGYPKTVKDYLTDDIITKTQFFLKEEFDINTVVSHGLFSKNKDPELSKTLSRIVYEIAYRLAIKDKFGGPERSIHTIEIPVHKGKEYFVDKIRTAKTGLYYPSKSYSGYEDSYEAPGLYNSKTHRILYLGQINLEIENINVELIHE